MDHMRLAEVYVPFQQYGPTWDGTTGLRLGTIFPELYRPYVPEPTEMQTLGVIKK